MDAGSFADAEVWPDDGADVGSCNLIGTPVVVSVGLLIDWLERIPPEGMAVGLANNSVGEAEGGRSCCWLIDDDDDDGADETYGWLWFIVVCKLVDGMEDGMADATSATTTTTKSSSIRRINEGFIVIFVDYFRSSLYASEDVSDDVSVAQIIPRMVKMRTKE